MRWPCSHRPERPRSGSPGRGRRHAVGPYPVCAQSRRPRTHGQSAAIAGRAPPILRMLDPRPMQMEGAMTLRFLGTTSDGGDCPTLYEIEGTAEILVQGDRETDPEHLAQLRD